MKKLVFTTVLLLFFFTSIAISQTQRNDYKKIDYIEVNQDHYGDFTNAVKKLVKPAFENLKKQGKVKEWRLYMVDYPGGTKSNYNFVSVTTATDIGTFENNFAGSGPLSFVPKSVNPNSTNNIVRLSNIVATEIWRVRSKIITDTLSGKPANYLVMDYMDVVPGKGLEYLMLEDEVAMPLHEARMENNAMAGWEVYSLVIPGGTEYGYNYATGNFFRNIGDIEFGFTQELVQQTMPGTDMGDLLSTIYETRDLVKSEVWELKMFVN